MISSAIIPEPLARLPWRLIFMVAGISGFGLIVLYSAAGGSAQPWAMKQAAVLLFFLSVAIAMSWLSEATIKAIADHGAAFMGVNVMYLKEGTRDHFMGFLSKEFPQMVEAYGRLYAGAYAAPDYVKAVRAMIDTLQQRHDVRRRPSTIPAESERKHDEAREMDKGKAASPQAAFEWT